MPAPSENQAASQVLSLLTLLLNSDLIHRLISELVHVWNASRFRGTYKVEDHHVTLDLIDSGGKTAIYTKCQQVTFLQNNVFAIQDQAWGDGEIFATYKCTPGIAVDRYKEGYRWKILISLRCARNSGETERFVIERTVKEGFTTPIGNLQTQVDHPTKDLTIGVIFPRTRYPKMVTIIEQNAKRTHSLEKDHVIPLSQGRVHYQWRVHKPRLYEGYILRWEW